MCRRKAQPVNSLVQRWNVAVEEVLVAHALMLARRRPNRPIWPAGSRRPPAPRRLPLHSRPDAPPHLPRHLGRPADHPPEPHRARGAPRSGAVPRRLRGGDAAPDDPLRHRLRRGRDLLHALPRRPLPRRHRLPAHALDAGPQRRRWTCTAPARRSGSSTSCSSPGPSGSSFDVRIHEVAPGDEIRRDGCVMRAFATEHRTPSVGWALVEDERPGRFHPERATSLGVPKGPLFGALQRGEPVTLADGRVVRPEEVVEPRRRGRTVVVTGDTRPCAGTIEAARGADVLVHDCTFGDAEAGARRGDDALDGARGGAGRARGGRPPARAHAPLHPLRPRVAAARRRRRARSGTGRSTSRATG